jgi:outer membrane protein assembly factor BamE
MKPRSGHALCAIAAVAILASGCGTVSPRTRDVLTSLTPYEVEVVQGNVVTAEQVAMLRPGLSREQVRELLGTPLLTDMFHAGRWDYVFTVHRQGIADQRRRLAVFFSDGRLDRFEGDEMPGEADVVARLDPRSRGDVGARP